jgi:hypothetical protein
MAGGDVHSILKPHPSNTKAATLAVRLGHTLNLVLLLDGVAAGGALGGVHDLVSQALRNGLDAAERGLTSLTMGKGERTGGRG